MNNKTVAGAILAGAATAAVVVVSLVSPPSTPRFFLRWDYAPDSNIVFNVYHTDNYLKTNVYPVVDDAGNLLRMETNRYWAWDQFVKIGTTNSHEWPLYTANDPFRFYRVKASNLITRLESQ